MISSYGSYYWLQLYWVRILVLSRHQSTIKGQKTEWLGGASFIDLVDSAYKLCKGIRLPWILCRISNYITTAQMSSHAAAPSHWRLDATSVGRAAPRSSPGPSPREPHALAWGPSSFHTKIFRVERTRLKTVEKLPIPCKFCTYRFITYSSTCYGKVRINLLMANIRNPDFTASPVANAAGLLWFGHVIWIGIC